MSVPSLSSLELKINELERTVDELLVGETLRLQQQPVTADVQSGNVVYWFADEHAYAPALAEAASDPVTGYYKPTARSEVVGVCLQKDTASTGLIVLSGLVELTVSQLAMLIEDAEFSYGRYYLSARTPGKLTREAGVVAVPVLILLGPATVCESGSLAIVNPHSKNFFREHVHFEIPLTAAAAGSHVTPAYGDPHVIEDPDPSLVGWLPADHDTFDNLAPAGAKFGYNIAADSRLSKVWPPVPASAACLFLGQNTGTNANVISGMLRLTSDFVQIDRHGIWWMSDCYNQVPWSHGPSSSSSSYSGGCVDPPMRLLLCFLKAAGINNSTVVTSLQAADGEPFEFVDETGEAATRGDLFARLSMELLVTSSSELGSIAIKRIDGKKFLAGRVTEGLVSTSPEISLSSTHSRLLDPDTDESDENPRVYQGVVSIEYTAGDVARECQPTITKLTDTLERQSRGILYIAFTPNRLSSATYTLQVPESGLPTGNLLMVVQILIIGTATGPLSAMTMRYQRVPKPGAVPSAITDGTTAVNFDVVTPSEDYNGNGDPLPAYTPISVSSEAFSVVAGDTVVITVQRAAAAAPTFSGEIGFIRFAGVVSRE